MVELSAAAAARAMEGSVIAGDPALRWNGAAIDSRKITGREIFFALPGEKVDGHEFVDQAVERGAASIVIHRDLEPASSSPAAWVRVEDTYQALHALTHTVRQTVPEHLVAITGSAGKTTTKELLAAMLARRYRSERSPGNLNNLYGFPLSLLNVRDDCEWMVAEMGMSTPGELRQVSLLGRPDAAVFTNVRPAHLENFSRLRDIADAKAELLAGLHPGGLIVANNDDPRVMYIVDRHRVDHPGARYLLYGLDERRRPDVWASQPETLPDRPGSRFTLTTGRETADVELPIHGLYNVENCLAAAACAHALGVPLAEAAAAVADFRPQRMRGEVHHRAGLTVVDDCYNSNPDAARLALESARELPARRHVAILGDMLELGPKAPSFHREVGKRAAELGFSLVVGVGELARELADAAGRSGATARWEPSAGQAASWAREALRGSELGEGDLILVKGSRGVALETVVEALLSDGEGS